MKRLLLGLIFACGAPPSPPVVIATQVEADAGAPDASASPAHVKAVGSDGPRDAKGLLGNAHVLVPTDVDSLLFVNGAEIRKRPKAKAWKAAIQGMLVGWDFFMPMKLIDPIDEVDWVVMTGSLFLGHTSKNQFFAHYNVSEPKADAIIASLLKEQPGARTEAGTELVARVDGADRAYLRPVPGVLAIVEPRDAAGATVVLKHEVLPKQMRPNELLRVIWKSENRSGFGFLFPRSIPLLRMWVTADGAGLVVAAEGECTNHDDAEDAAQQLRESLDRACDRKIARLMAGDLCDSSRIWVDGVTVRYDAPLDERLVEAYAAMSRSRSR